MDFEAHYTSMHQDAINALMDDSYFIDPLIDSEADNRFGITLLVRPPKFIIDQIQNLLEGVKKIVSHQYYYPETDIHFTVLSIISCYDGFHLSQIDLNEYVQLISNELKRMNRFDIELKGIALTNSGILVKGFPDASLNELRNQLRTCFKKSTLQHSIDSRYALKTAHSTVMRFRTEVKEKSALIDVVHQFKDARLGTFQVDQMELVFNDWYQRKSKSKLLKDIHLS